jgi:RecA-family ATPase
LSAEEELEELHRRLEPIAATCGVDPGDLGDLHLVPLAGLDAVLAAPSKPGVIAATAVWRGLEALVEEINPRLVIIDTSADAYAGDENKRYEVRQFIGLLRGLAIRCDLAVLLLSHPSQTGLSSGSGTSGSTAWSNSVRSRLYLDKSKASDGEEINADIRILSVKKANYGQPTPHCA